MLNISPIKELQKKLQALSWTRIETSFQTQYINCYPLFKEEIVQEKLLNVFSLNTFKINKSLAQIKVQTKCLIVLTGFTSIRKRLKIKLETM